MAARVCKVKLEFVGGPNDGEVHVLRGRRFVVGPAENADVRYEAERCLQGDSRIVFELDGRGRLCVGGVLDTANGEEETEQVPVAEGQVLQVGATEIMVAEIVSEAGSGARDDVGEAVGARSAGNEDGQIECSNPECGALNPVGRTWCKKCGRDL